jgi:hypothetical protein
MSEQQPYTYVLLRYRHDPLAGEFANVGVLLHAPKGRLLRIKVRSSAGRRLTRLFPDMSPRTLRSGLRSIERAVQTLAAGDGGGLLSGLGDAAMLAGRALPTDDSSFVWGPVGSGLTRDPEQTLASLYGRFVARYDDAAGTAMRDDAAVWRPVHQLLVAREIVDRLGPKTIHSSVEQVDFEHAWKNGAWHVYQPLSFDLTSDDSIRDKAARWAGYLVGLRDSEEPFKPHFIVGPPRNAALMDAYQRAVGLLRLPQPDAEVVEMSAAERLVDRIEAELRAHDDAPVR